MSVRNEERESENGKELGGSIILSVLVRENEDERSRLNRHMERQIIRNVEKSNVKCNLKSRLRNHI